MDLRVRAACRPETWLDSLRPARSRHVSCVDLTSMTFCEPLGLVGLACFMERRLDEGRRVVVQAPVNINVANYLARMRLGRMLDSLGAEHDLPRVREWEVGDTLLELEAFEGARGAERLAQIVHSAAVVVDDRLADALYLALCEVGQNVPHHSGTPKGFMAAQVTHGRTQLHFAVGDAGIGMLATLRHRGASTDGEALDLALRCDISGTASASRGNGLPEVLQCVSELSGCLKLVSGSASVDAARGRLLERTGGAWFAGTLVQGTVKIT